MKRLARALVTWETIRLLAFVVAPVWGAGVYVSERTTSVLEEQLEASQEREAQWAFLFKEILGCNRNEGLADDRQADESNPPSP